jgi:hypothetical protein
MQENYKEEYIGEVRTIKENRKGKLLFRVASGENGLAIVIKNRGSDETVKITLATLKECCNKSFEDAKYRFISYKDSSTKNK